MGIYKADGTEVKTARVTDLAEKKEDSDKYVIKEDVHAEFNFIGTETKGKKLLFYKGQELTKDQFDEAVKSAKDDTDDSDDKDT